MLVEIPNFEVILGVMIAFLIGVGGVYLYYVISTHFKSKSNAHGTTYSDRFQYYENQLIDMKIRLDSMGVQDAGGIKPPEPTPRPASFVGGLERKPYAPKDPGKQQAEFESAKNNTPPTTPEPTNQYNNSTDHVLHLITNNPMTSRDIQTMLKKSREHTSRLMKKLYVDGYVKRNVESKPYTYSITEKGAARIKT